MMKPMVLATLVALAVPMFGSAAFAGPIERACNRSDRSAANPRVCGCIQHVADQTLRGGDQRKAAKLFNDPDMAHKIWLSKRQSDDDFWDRYKAFGASAEASCG